MTTDKERFFNYRGAKINYSENRLKDGIFIKSQQLLFENYIEYQEISYHEFYHTKGIFLTGSESDLPFDPFAATFYLITRYEEYTDDKRDEHDRFESAYSVATKYNFLKEPVVDNWAFLINTMIKEKYPSYQLKMREFEFISTIDIDNAFAILHKGIYRIIGGFVKSLVRLDVLDVLNRILVFTGYRKDPYDTYDYIENIHQQYKLKPVLFYLFGRLGRYDRNVSRGNENFQELVQRTVHFAELGIHPSYTSNFDFLQLKEEIKKLAVVAGKWINYSRQHYLKLNLPKTYLNLIRAGITHDFTMGYSTNIGFRAGTCTPFYFFDLKNNVETKLKVVPFQVMDVTLMQYLNLDTDTAKEEIQKIIQKIKMVGGTFVSLWHNESLSDKGRWKGWRSVFEDMLQHVHS